MNARFLIILAALIGGCSRPTLPPASPEKTETLNPLGPSYFLLPLPSADPGLLGRVLDAPPEANRSLEESARPNVCAAKLSAQRTTPLVAAFDNAEQLSMGVSAGATLSTFGFYGSATRATHFIYRLRTTEQVAVSDTVEYGECCAASGQCGYGFVAALVMGQGEYAAAEEVGGTGQADLVFAEATASGAYKVLNRRAVSGYVAALVRVTKPQARASVSTGALGLIRETPVSELVRQQYGEQQIVVTRVKGGGWAFSQKGKLLRENDFAASYGVLTGTDELSQFDRNRVPGLLWASGAGAAVGAAWLTYSLASLPWTRPDPGNVCGDLACAGVFWGTGMLLLSVPLFAVSLTTLSDGDFDDHFLSEFQGRGFANRYNRLLLRKLRSEGNEYRKRSEGVDLGFRLSPVGWQFYGQF